MANWLARYKCRVNIAGTSQRCTAGSYTETASKFDATPVDGSANANGLLAEQMGVDTVNTKLDFTVITKSDDIRTYAVGALLPVVSFVNSAGVTRVGQFYILSRSEAVAAKGAFEIALSGEFTDVVSGQ